MGGFFGAVGKRDVMEDVFFGTDYHSHLGSHRAGMAAYNTRVGLQRDIHNIQNAPFRTKFEHVLEEMEGCAAIGCISDREPQPLIIRGHLGSYAICVIGMINNIEALASQYLDEYGGHFTAMEGSAINATELVAALINRHDDLAAGIRATQQAIDGTASILLLRDDGSLVVARDLVGRLPMIVGRNEDGYCVTFESFVAEKVGYELYRELGPGEIVSITAEGVEQLLPPGDKLRVCAFLWSYYGYPTSSYEGVNVEMMRYRNGRIMAREDAERGGTEDVDYVSGVPDSGLPHAIGYANESHIPFARAFVKYTPTWSRSFIPSKQSDRNRIAKMKQIPVPDLVKGKSLLLVDDSIVRGTQIHETVDFLYNSGAKAVHMRSACPPIMHSCKYLNFSRATSEMELIARRTIQELEGDEGQKHLDEYRDGKTERGRRLRETICNKLHLASLEFQSYEGVIEAIGLDPCHLCTYCWDGKE